MIAGAAVGAAVGGAAGQGLAATVNPTVEDNYWRGKFASEPYSASGRTYDDYAPAYQLGYSSLVKYGGDYGASEDRLESDWDRVKGASRLTWNEAQQATRAAWERVERKT